MAKRPPFEIGGQKIAPGTRATVELPLSHLFDRTPVGMAVQVIHGRQDGPCVFVSAAVHGDEIIGVEIVRRLLAAPQLKSLKGTLMVIPIVNAFGFMNRSRYLPDRRDLNRCFPGYAAGSLGARMAHLFLTEIVERADLGIDLHSAAIHRTNLPQIRISPDNTRTEALAHVFGAPVVMVSPLREGSLRASAAEMGRDVLLYEAGEGLRFDETAIRAGLRGILRVLGHMGMLKGKGIAPSKIPSQFCPASKWLRAPSGGLLRLFRAEGDVVREGDVMAAVADPFGDAEEEIIAPFDGVIVGRAVLPVINEGDAVYHLAQVASAERAENRLEGHADALAGKPLWDEDEII